MDIRTVFIGGTLRGYELFKSLLQNNIVPAYSVFLKEDEHENLKFSHLLAQEANEKRLPYSIKKKLNDDDYKIISDTFADMVIVCGWRTIIDVNKIKNVRVGLLAAHDSLLPKYRGFAPLNWAIINGESETGVTVFKICEGEVDSGEILVQKKVSIEESDYAFDVYQKLIQATIDAYFEVFKKYLEGNLVFLPQDESEATYTCKRTPNDGRINWQKSSREIFNLIRGLAYPYPGAFFFYKGRKYIVRKACIGDLNDRNFVGRICGRVISIKDSVEVLCGLGSIRIIQIEDEEGNVISPSEIIKSITDTLE